MLSENEAHAKASTVGSFKLLVTWKYSCKLPVLGIEPRTPTHLSQYPRETFWAWAGVCTQARPWLSSWLHVANSTDTAAGNLQPTAGRAKFKSVQLSHAELERDPPIRHGRGGQDLPCLNPLPRTASVVEQNQMVYAGQKSPTGICLSRSWPCVAFKPSRYVGWPSTHVSLLRNMQFTGWNLETAGHTEKAAA